MIPLNKDDFVLACCQVITDHDLVTIPLEGLPCFWYNQVLVCLELQKRLLADFDAETTRHTLKETTKPSAPQSLTICDRILGTWSISMTNEPLPD